MNALAGRRARAYLLDCVGYLGIAVCEVPIGVAVLQLGWGDNRPFGLAMSAVPPIIAARAEVSPARATWGKRRVGLVAGDSRAAAPSQPVPFRRALARNLVKIALPSQLGHVIAFGAIDGGFETLDPATVGTTALLYPLLGVMIWTAVRGEGEPSTTAWPVLE